MEEISLLELPYKVNISILLFIIIYYTIYITLYYYITIYNYNMQALLSPEDWESVSAAMLRMLLHARMMLNP